MNEQGTRKRTLKFWAALGAVMVGVALLGPSRSQAPLEQGPEAGERVMARAEEWKARSRC